MTAAIVVSEVLDMHMIVKHNSKKGTYTVAITDADWINIPRKHTYTGKQMQALVKLLKLRGL